MVILKKITKLAKNKLNWISPVSLVLLALWFFSTTYTPGLFLTGWDTLHPEFNFDLNFSRLLQGVWRGEQGLGALAGHSHMADLPRVVFLWLAHFVLPLSAVRWSYLLLCLIVGPLGMYFFLKYFLHISDSGAKNATPLNAQFWSKFASHLPQSLRHSSKNAIEFTAFLGGLFYLASIGSVQQFYVPFEMFPTQYAWLPWLILFSFKYLRESKIKYLFWYGLATLAATPQAYAAHLWYAFFGVYTAFLFMWVVVSKKRVFQSKKVLFLVLVTLAVNSFWLVPNLYFIATGSSVPKESKQNRIFSQEYRLRNRENGVLPDVAILKGFYLNWTIFNIDEEHVEKLMPEWSEHADLPVTRAAGFAMFGLSLIGIGFAIYRKHRVALAFTPFFAIPFILLMNHTQPFEWFFNTLTKLSLFEEALRFVFTKCSILFMFGYGLFFAYGLCKLLTLELKNYIKIGLAAAALVFVLWCGLPLFSGHLISDKMKVSIPQNYFNFWKYMENKPDGVVLSLPLHSFSGWQYYSWGYQGAGFLWFGLKQPLLDRDFDRWSIANEASYREFHYSLYSADSDAFARNLEKFNTSYIVFDRSVISTAEKNKTQILFTRETEDLLQKLITEGILKKEATFGSIELYTITQKKSEVYSTQNIPNVLPTYRWGFNDQAYSDVGFYESNTKKSGDDETIFYPFRDALQASDRINHILASIGPDTVSFKQNNPTGGVNIGNLQLFFSESKVLSAKDLYATAGASPNISIQNNGAKTYIDFENSEGQSGVYLELPEYSHTAGYIIGFESRSTSGLPLRFCIKNLYTNLCDLYDELSRFSDFSYDYFMLPPAQLGQGYSISIDNISLGNFTSHNQLSEVVIVPFAYSALAQYKNFGVLKADSDQSPTTLKPKVDLAFMKTFEPSKSIPSSTIALMQTYTPGWIMYEFKKPELLHKIFPFIGGSKIESKTEINNWANGWNTKIVPKGSELVIVFWPQYLQFAGFALGFLTLVLLGIFTYLHRQSGHKMM